MGDLTFEFFENRSDLVQSISARVAVVNIGEHSPIIAGRPARDTEGPIPLAVNRDLLDDVAVWVRSAAPRKRACKGVQSNTLECSTESALGGWRKEYVDRTTLLVE